MHCNSSSLDLFLPHKLIIATNRSTTVVIHFVYRNQGTEMGKISKVRS